MPDKMMPGPVQDAACIREAVCIHTKKIYDSCKEEDIASYIPEVQVQDSAPVPFCQLSSVSPSLSPA